jgi:hypothetical protein
MRKTFLVVLAIALMAAAAASALTAPKFVANNLTTAKVKCFISTPGDMPLGSFECYAGSERAQFVFRSGVTGTVKRIAPTLGFTVADTSIYLEAYETKLYTFRYPYPDWVTVTTTSTDAHVHAE